MSVAKDKAKEQDQPQGVTELDVEGSSVTVTAVRPPDDGGDAEYLEGQNQALLDYRVSGHPGTYVDPSRDQEPDIAPELGVAPHPELANPAPPKASPDAHAFNSPVTVPIEEKVENAKEAEKQLEEQTDAINKANQEAFEAEQKAKEEEENPQPPAELSSSDVLNLHLRPDESPKTSGSAGPQNAR